MKVLAKKKIAKEKNFLNIKMISKRSIQTQIINQINVRIVHYFNLKVAPNTLDTGREL